MTGELRGLRQAMKVQLTDLTDGDPRKRKRFGLNSWRLSGAPRPPRSTSTDAIKASRPEPALWTQLGD